MRTNSSLRRCWRHHGSFLWSRTGRWWMPLRVYEELEPYVAVEKENLRERRSSVCFSFHPFGNDAISRLKRSCMNHFDATQSSAPITSNVLAYTCGRFMAGTKKFHWDSWNASCLMVTTRTISHNHSAVNSNAIRSKVMLCHSFGLERYTDSQMLSPVEDEQKGISKNNKELGSLATIKKQRGWWRRSGHLINSKDRTLSSPKGDTRILWMLVFCRVVSSSV